MKRNSLALFLGLIAFAGTSFAQQPIKLTLGHSAPLGNPRHEAALLFADRIKQKTAGRYEIFVAHSGVLGDNAAMVNALQLGLLDISANSQGAVSAVVPEYSALGLPFLFPNPEKALQLLDGPIGQELATRTAAKDMVVLGYWDNGIRHITNGKRAIRVPSDVKGLKFRNPPDPVTVNIIQALGADAQQIKFSELYVALQLGLVDGQENSLTNITSMKFYEVQKYLSLSGHKYEVTPFLMSKRAWGKLTPADQKLFQEAAADATQLQRKLSKEVDDKLLTEIKGKGVQVDTIDRAQFVAATKPVYEKWNNGPIGDFVKRVVEASK